MSNVVNPLCPECSNQCPCTLLETIGKNCNDVKSLINDGEYAALQFDSDCNVNLINVQELVHETIINNPQTIPIGDDINGYTADGASLLFDNVNKILSFDQELVRRKFPKQIIAEVFVDLSKSTFPSRVSIISTQNVPVDQVNIDIYTIKKQVGSNPNYFWLQLDVNGAGWVDDSLYPTTMVVIQNEQFVCNFDNNDKCTPIEATAFDTKDLIGNRFNNSWNIIVEAKLIDTIYSLSGIVPIEQVIKVGKVIDPFLFVNPFVYPSFLGSIRTGKIEAVNEYSFRVLIQQRY